MQVIVYVNQSEAMTAGLIDVARQDDAVRGPLVDARPIVLAMATAAAHDDRLSTVTELAKELGITARALRFYEDKGLITPRRVATTRVYTHRERARMILILRGKRLGFSLREIKDYLDLYDADPKRETQTRALLKKIEIRCKQLEEQKIALDQALIGLKDLERDALAALAKAQDLDAAAVTRRQDRPTGRRPSSLALTPVASSSKLTR